jgi:hypothetical protein
MLFHRLSFFVAVALSTVSAVNGLAVDTGRRGAEPDLAPASPLLKRETETAIGHALNSLSIFPRWVKSLFTRDHETSLRKRL